jgi:Tfp pilus assembly protein PilF
MEKLTTSKPELIAPWLQLGLAQLNLKKYPEAENSFKVVLGKDASSEKARHADDFYSPGRPILRGR